MTFVMRTIGGGVLVAALCVVSPPTAAAQDIKTLVKKGSFDDVKFELNNAIVGRGFSVEFGGQIGTMLDRTGADVGSAKPIYKQAEFMEFCSAKLSRRMMEADALNVAFCPYSVFIYETIAAPGEIVVGYRVPAPRGNDASRAAIADVDKLLESIIKDAVQ